MDRETIQVFLLGLFTGWISIVVMLVQVANSHRSRMSRELDKLEKMMHEALDREESQPTHTHDISESQRNERRANGEDI